MEASDPRHGTDAQPITHRVPGCECDHCESARRRQRRQYKLRRAGKPALIPTELVTRHLAHLIEDGWSAASISTSSGVGPATISEALAGRARQMRVTTAARLLAVGGGARNSTTSSVGTLRRLRALAAIGWPMREVCARAGLNPRYGAQTMGKRRATVSTAAARAIAVVYDELCMTPAPTGSLNNHARTFARNRAWPSPLAWTNIDDPNEQPTTAKELVRLSQSEQYAQERADRIADITHLADGGASGAEIARRLDVTLETLKRFCERQSRWDLWDRIRPADPNREAYRNGHGLYAMRTEQRRAARGDAA